MVSHSFDTSSGGSWIYSVEVESGCFSTSTFTKTATVVAALVSSAVVVAVAPATAEHPLALQGKGISPRKYKPKSPPRRNFAIEPPRTGALSRFLQNKTLAATP